MVRPNDNNCNEDVDYNVDSNDNVHIFGRQIRIIMKMACDNACVMIMVMIMNPP